jgi:hypothetical protein
MTRKSWRELERDLEGLDDTDQEDSLLTGDIVVSWEQPDDWEPDPDAVVIDFTGVDT